jgi:hypothetical protein
MRKHLQVVLLPCGYIHVRHYFKACYFGILRSKKSITLIKIAYDFNIVAYKPIAKR